MGRMITYLMMIVGLMILFNIAGLATSSGTILGLFGIDTAGNPSDFSVFSSTAFWIAIIAAITSLVAVSGIRIGVFGAPNNTTFAAATLAIGVLVVFIADITSILHMAMVDGGSWVGWLVIMILIPLMFGFGMALFDWVRGMDN